MKKYRRVLTLILLLLVIVCGIALALPRVMTPGEVSVHGAVTRDGKPLVWDGAGDNPLLRVIFFPEVRDSTTEFFPADCDIAKGTFAIAKIPTGKYKVSIQQIATPLKDLLNFGYDPAHTTLTCAVERDGQEINFDLPKALPHTSTPAMPKGRPDAAPKGNIKEKPKSPDDSTEPK
jgi:hypothetical protein